MHLFQSNYTTNPLIYLLAYRLRLTDINIIIKLYLEYFFIAHFLILKVYSTFLGNSLILQLPQS